MSSEELKLELLKLTYTHGREAAEAVARAQVLERYVKQGSAPTRETLRVPKKPGTPNPLE